MAIPVPVVPMIKSQREPKRSATIPTGHDITPGNKANKAASTPTVIGVASRLKAYKANNTRPARRLVILHNARARTNRIDMAIPDPRNTALAVSGRKTLVESAYCNLVSTVTAAPAAAMRPPGHSGPCKPSATPHLTDVLAHATVLAAKTRQISSDDFLR